MTAAGMSAIAAGVTLVVSGACLGVFFSTEREAWGRANDATTALFGLLMIPAVVAVYVRYAPGSRWAVGIAAMLGIVGALIVAVTSGMTAAAKLDWLVSAKVGAVGFAGLLAWVAATSWLILGRGGLPDGLAWLGLVTVGVSVVAGIGTALVIRAQGSLQGDSQPPSSLWAAYGVAFVGVVGWCVWLGIALIG